MSQWWRPLVSLKGGGTIVEKLEKRDDAARSYSYSIVESPLPVANYLSTISVAAQGAGSTITWSGKYDAKGASEADAKKTIDGIYQAGLECFQAKRTPVRVKKTRQIKNLEPRFDSIETEKALDALVK